MDWWVWIFVTMAIAVLAAGLIPAIQRLRRRGGVVVHQLGNEPKGRSR